ncbi:2-oxo acid dehydrogenase subunit E2 [Rhodobacteraceae bacterium KMM 6894]|nr:2-oxo acid dehydrogenase subunit E2 [Rhodobacteraceae bacterium KMM 6894]
MTGLIPGFVHLYAGEEASAAAIIQKLGDADTVVAIGWMVGFAKKAADKLAKDGIECTVLDPRTTSPLDTDAILASVEKTGRLVVVDEASPRCGMASDISAIVAEYAFGALKAPVKRVTPPHSPVPFAPGKLAYADAEGGTFTVTSLGKIGGTAFTPIINAPEVAILGVSRARQKPVEYGGEIALRLILPLSLSYDHRVIDGAKAALFMGFIRDQLEKPDAFM